MQKPEGHPVRFSGSEDETPHPLSADSRGRGWGPHSVGPGRCLPWEGREPTHLGRSSVYRAARAAGCDGDASVFLRKGVFHRFPGRSLPASVTARCCNLACLCCRLGWGDACVAGKWLWGARLPSPSGRTLLRQER